MGGVDIVIDFDGTVVTHDFPEVGVDIGAVEVLKRITDSGHKLILFTMRSEKYLDEAVEWFELNGIPLYGINKHPLQHTWTKSPKAQGVINIDDRDLFTPLTNKLPDGTEYDGRPFVDWKKVKRKLKETGIYE